MNMPHHPNLRLASVLMAAGLFLSAGSAPAQSLYWDGGTVNISTNGDGISQGGVGTWDNATQNWDQGTNSAHIAWVSGDNAYFAGTGSNINVAAAITANAITVSTNNYVFTNSDLTVNAITNTSTVAFYNNIANSTGLTKAGSGTATIFSSSPGLNGPVTVVAGTLNFQGPTGGPAGFGNVAISNGATFKITATNTAAGTEAVYEQAITGPGNFYAAGGNYNTFIYLGNTASTFSGSVTIGAVNLAVASLNNTNSTSSALGLTTNIIFAGNSAQSLTYAGNGDTTWDTITCSGAGAAIIAGNNGGNPNIPSYGPLVWNGPLVYTSSQNHNIALEGAAGFTNVFAPAITDYANGGTNYATTVQKVGTTTWMLTGSNSFSGGVQILAGQLIITNDDALGVATNPLTLWQSTSSGYAGYLCSLSNTVTLATNRPIFTLGPSTKVCGFNTLDTNNLNIPCFITGTNGIQKGSGSYAYGWVTFTCDTNNYTGDFSAAGGNTAFTSVSNQGTPSSLGKGNPVTGGVITFNNSSYGTLRYVGAGNSSTLRPLSWSGANSGFALDASGGGTIAYLNPAPIITSAGSSKGLALTGTNAGANTLNQSVTDYGAYASSLNFNGSGQWVLTGTNNYSGVTTLSGNGTLTVNSLNYISSGTLSPNPSSSLGHPTTVANGTIGIGSTIYYATLNYTGTGETSDRVINLAGTTGGAVLAQSGSGLLEFTSPLTVTGVGNKTLTLSGSTAGTGELAGAVPNDPTGTNKTSLVKTGTGKWTLAAANTFTGNTTVSNGILALAGSGSLASTNILVVGAATLDVSGVTGGTYSLAAGQTLTATNGGTALINGNLNATAGGVTLRYTNGTPVVSIAGGALTLGSATPLTLTVTNGGRPLPGGTYVIITNGASGAVTGTAPASVVLSGDVTNTATVAISGGKLVLTVPVTAVYPPVLSGITAAGGQAVLNFSGTNGQGYHVYTSTNLLVPLINWVSVASGTLTGLPMTYTNTAATNAQQFYIITSP